MSPRLTYFDFPGGRGEDCRLAFAIADVWFEDDRVPGKTWGDRKAEIPFGALPVLTVDGKGTIAQSNAILGYIGRTAGLLPTDPWEAARHEALMGAVEDLRRRFDAASGMSDEAKKADREKLVAEYLPMWSASLEAEIVGPFVGGEAISVADLKLFVFVKSIVKGVMDHIPATWFDAYPKAAAQFQAVLAHPVVKAWYEKHPAGAP